MQGLMEDGNDIAPVIAPDGKIYGFTYMHEIIVYTVWNTYSFYGIGIFMQIIAYFSDGW